MKFFILSIFFAFISLNSSAQANGKVTRQPKVQIETIYQDIDVETAQKIIKESPNYILLDVRTPEEIALGKIGNAIELDIKAKDFKDRLSTLDKNKQYIVYCHAGGRSATAMQMMKEMGFKQVYNLKSGFKAWPKNK